MIEVLLFSALAGLAVGALTLALAGVQDTVASWLRRHGLEHSLFMDALVIFDHVRSALKRTIFLRDRRKRLTRIEETELSQELIDDPEVRAKLACGEQVAVPVCI